MPNAKHKVSLRPLTLAYIRLVAARSSMYMVEFNIAHLEHQLFGYDAALADAGSLGEHARFKYSFNDYVWINHQLSCSCGWASALLKEYCQGEHAFKKFLALVERATSRN
jgi:hypothetical protein